jgi:uroporphyrinogen-III synthase
MMIPTAARHGSIAVVGPVSTRYLFERSSLMRKGLFFHSFAALEEPSLDESMLNTVDGFTEDKIDRIIFCSGQSVRDAFEVARARGKEEEFLNAMRSRNPLGVGTLARYELEKRGIKLASHAKTIQDLIDSSARIWENASVVCVYYGMHLDSNLVQSLSKTAKSFALLWAYRSPIDYGSNNSEFIDKIVKKSFNVLVFVHPMGVHGFFSAARRTMKEEDIQNVLSHDLVICSIGALTRKALIERCVEPQISPKRFGIESLIRELERYLDSAKE